MNYKAKILSLLKDAEQTAVNYAGTLEAVRTDKHLSPAGVQDRTDKARKLYGGRLEEIKTAIRAELTAGAGELETAWTDQLRNTFTPELSAQLNYLKSGQATGKDIQSIIDQHRGNQTALNVISASITGADDIETAALRATIPGDHREKNAALLAKAAENVKGWSIDGDMLGLSIAGTADFIGGLADNLSLNNEQ